MARVQKCTKAVNDDRTAATFKFSDGTFLSLALSDLDEDTQTNLIFHGILQKVGDSFAGSRTSCEFRFMPSWTATPTGYATFIER